MKKMMLTALVAVIAMVSVNAQEFKLGGSAGYSTEIEEVGFSVDAVYSINESWEVAANYYFIPEIENALKISFIDVNAHYMFSESFYALAGLDLATIKLDFFGESASDNETGANLGIGGRFPLSDKLSFFTEAKYVTTYDGLFNVRAGLLFSF